MLQEILNLFFIFKKEDVWGWLDNDIYPQKQVLVLVEALLVACFGSASLSFFSWLSSRDFTFRDCFLQTLLCTWNMLMEKYLGRFPMEHLFFRLRWLESNYWIRLFLRNPQTYYNYSIELRLLCNRINRQRQLVFSQILIYEVDIFLAFLSSEYTLAFIWIHLSKTEWKESFALDSFCLFWRKL